MHKSKHCRLWNDRRKSKRAPEPHKLSKGHGTRSGRVDAMGRNHGMRQTHHGPRVEHFGGNFARKAYDVLSDDVMDYARRYGDERVVEEVMLHEPTGMGRVDEPAYSLFDEIMACPVKETRRKRRRAKGNCEYMRIVIPTLRSQMHLQVQEFARVESVLDNVVDANDELSDIVSHIGTEISDGDIVWAEENSSETSESSVEDFGGDCDCGDSDSMEEYDDCWDAYEEDDREWVELFESEEDELYYGEDDPFAVT